MDDRLPDQDGHSEQTIVSTAIPQPRLASGLFFLLVPVTAILNRGSVRFLAILLFGAGLLLWLTGNYEQVTADEAGLRKRSLLSRLLNRLGLRTPASTSLAWEDIHRVACMVDNQQSLGWGNLPSGSMMILGFSTQMEIPFRTSRFLDLCRMIREHLDRTRLDFCVRKIEHIQSKRVLKKAEGFIKSGRADETLILRTGYGYCLWGDYLKAREYLELAYRHDASRSELKEDLAEILLFSGEVDRGLRLQREVAAARPDDAGPLVRQGHLLMAIEERNKAMACFLKGTGMAFSSDTAHLALSLVYEDMGIDGLAKQHFESAAQKTQDARLRAHLNAWKRYRDRLIRDEQFSTREIRRLRLFQAERRLRRGVYWLFIAALSANAANIIKIAVSGHGFVGEKATPLLWGGLGVVSGALLLLWVVRRFD